MLTAEQKHMMHLVAKDAGEDGWTPVSAPIMKMLDGHPHIKPPDTVVEIETLPDGSGRARLTDEGKAVYKHL